MQLAATPDEGFGPYTKRQVEEVVDRAAIYSLHLAPQGPSPGAVIRGSRDGTVVGFRSRGAFERLDLELVPASLADGVLGHNTLGGRVGTFSGEWRIVPWEHCAEPDRLPPETPFDPTRSQRIALQRLECRFGDGGDGFVAFGVGRTLPTRIGGELRLVVSAVAEVTERSGRLEGHDGNLVLVGEITPDGELEGHVAVRFIDLPGTLRSPLAAMPLAREPLGGDFTYLGWLGQKGEGPEQVNTLSFTRDGRLRGGNVATELRLGRVTFVTGGPEGLLASDLESGPVVGREIGFGAIDPDLSPVGTPDAPFPFHGVARYEFFDEDGNIAGGITTNVMEGRRIDVDLGLEGQPTYRFGFFGPIVSGSGCFEDATGLFYGVSGSVFNTPPGGQAVTHYYVARLDDPCGRYRAGKGRTGSAGGAS